MRVQRSHSNILSLSDPNSPHAYIMVVIKKLKTKFIVWFDRLDIYPCSWNILR